MILHEFPDLQWLKDQIEQRFANRHGWNHMSLESDGFPSVIINTVTKEAFRPDIAGPVSLFLNIHGSSLCKTDHHTVQVSEQFFFVSNQHQPYTLEILADKPVETFNIHFGEQFSEAVLNALVTPADNILANNGGASTVSFYNQLYRRDDNFNRLIAGVYHSHGENGFDKLLFEEQLTELFAHLLLQHRHVMGAVQQLPPVKQSTKIELYRRLSYSMDYIHSGFCRAIDLDKLAATACLSKYHFLRLFKLAYGLSPHQYIQQLRLEKAKRLLQDGSLAINDIADALGFENSQSFSRLFYQRTGFYPSQYRVFAK